MHVINTKRGSALIMTVVLTVLLALVGALFVMGARIEKMATSSISENKELVAGVDAVIEKISQVLVEDTPGVAGQEYYDYPGPEDPWLASLEPYGSDPNYKWAQITDINDVLGASAWDSNAVIISEYQDKADILYPANADADGDGVADAVWIKLDNINTAKGKPIYAAVRIIDHGAMLNVNTAYKFDPNQTDENLINGSSQLQINLAALARVADDVDELDASRVGPGDSLQYESGVIWQPVDPCVPYTPFDISDELELRNRYFLTTLAKTRLEAVWNSTIGHSNFKRVPYDGVGLYNEAHWFRAINQDANQPDRRHFLTTYNFDRIINLVGDPMVNVNIESPDVGLLYDAIKAGLLAGGVTDPNAIAAQLAVNIVDFRDGDAEVTVYPNLDDGKTYYGFEAQPFISEIGCIFDLVDPNSDNQYAVELYNPFNVEIPLTDFMLSLSNGTDIPLEGSIGPKSYFVIADVPTFQAPSGDIEPNQVAPGLKLSANYVDTTGNLFYDFCTSYNLTLSRNAGTDTIRVDKQETKFEWFVGAPWATEIYAQRDDDDNWHIVYQTMQHKVNNTFVPGSLGAENSVTNTKLNYNLALANADFVTIGDIALPLTIGPGTDANSTIGQQLNPQPAEEEIRLDLTNPHFANIFRYLTVFDPANYGLGGEKRIKGRININTAPWFVIAQLPWITNNNAGDEYKLAQAIVAYRDKLKLPSGEVDYSDGRGKGMDLTNPSPPIVREDLGFANVGELLNVTHALTDGSYNQWCDIRRYDRDGEDLSGMPDLTPNDKAVKDFEERDVIFSRISNLVTVRSDVFCAYILVRLGTDGPQKRVMAILDRSGVSEPTDKVKIVAWHPVPDPR